MYYMKENKIVPVKGAVRRLDGSIELNPSALTDLEMAEKCGLYRYVTPSYEVGEQAGELTFDEDAGTCTHTKVERDVETVRAECLATLESELASAIAQVDAAARIAAIKGEEATLTDAGIATAYTTLKASIGAATSAKELLEMDLVLIS